MIPRNETIWLDSVDSTNRFALENFSCFASGTLIVARTQSSGHGTKGRVWLSPPDVNVYASLILKNFPFDIHQAAWLGSLSAFDVLVDYLPAKHLAVKWPNDVLCEGRKIAGILCESRGGGIVIGAGININMTREMLAGLGREATSLYMESGVAAPDVSAFALSFRETALQLCAKATRDGVEVLYNRWCALNFLAGRRVSLRLPDGALLDCIVTEFTPDGAMTVTERATGAVRSLVSCDIVKF